MCKSYRFIILPIVFFLSFLFSCSKQSDVLQFAGGKDLINSSVHVSIIDSFRLDMATAQIDSLITTGLDTIVVGNYTDDRLGLVKTQSYFRIGLPSNVVGVKDIFDSITLIMQPNGYYYGDTTVTQQLSVYQLGQSLDLSTASDFYNTSSLLAFMETPLGVLDFKPQPKSKTLVEIPLNHDFGQTLFDMMLNNDPIVSNLDNFLDYFKGFLIMPTGSNHGAVIGYSMADTAIKMCIYTHANNEEQTTKKFLFYAQAGSTHFSRIRYDRTGTSLQNLVTQNHDISSTLTNHEVYMQGGTGLVPIIKIPGIAKLLEYDHTVLLKAELILKPVDNTFTFSQMPVTISYYSCNNENQLIRSYLDPNTGSALYGAINYIDPVYKEGTYYTFNITPYVLEQLANISQIGKTGLMLFYRTPTFNASVNRLVFGDSDHPTQKALLKIYLMHYE